MFGKHIFCWECMARGKYCQGQIVGIGAWPRSHKKTLKVSVDSLLTARTLCLILRHVRDALRSSPKPQRLGRTDRFVGHSKAASENMYGDRSSIGGALDCGSSGCGFEPHRSPFFIFPQLISMCYNTPCKGNPGEVERAGCFLTNYSHLFPGQKERIVHAMGSRLCCVSGLGCRIC